MKKICLVIPSLQAGGMERVMSELISHFSAKVGIEVHLVLFDIKREIFYPIPSTITVHKPGFKFNNKLRFYYTIKTLWFLRRELKLIQPHSVLSFGELWNSFVLLALFGLRFPVVISERSSPARRFKRFNLILRKWLYPRANRVIVQTEKAKQLIQSQLRCDKIDVIGNPIRQINSYDQNHHRENIVLTVGRLIETKHHDKLIEMFATIAVAEWKLVIVGYDHLKQKNMIKLKELAHKLDVEDRIIFAGKRNDVENYYLQSKIFAFTSSSEGFPNAIGEAMSAGLPVVAFDCIAGPSEMITDGEDGFLVPLFELDLFQQQLGLLMKDDELRTSMGQKARASIQRFDPNIICEKYYSILIDESVKV